MSYSNLKALIKKELIDMVNKHTTRLRALQANEPNNKVVAAFNAITPYASKDEVDPVDIFILLNKEAQFAAKTVSFGFLGFQKKDDDFVSELKTLIKIILRQDILSETRYYPDKAFKFSAEKMTFIENIFGKNSALDDDDAALKKPEYISFRRANPQFSNLNLSGDDIEFIQRFYSLVELKENFIVQQNQQAQSAAEKEKNDDTTKQALESLSNQMQTMTTQLLTVTSELKNVREDVRKKDEDLAEVYTLMRWIKSQSRIKTILQANGSTEAKKYLHCHQQIMLQQITVLDFLVRCQEVLLIVQQLVWILANLFYPTMRMGK